MYRRNKNARLLTGGLVGVPPGYGDEHWDDVTLLLDGSYPTNDLSNTNQDTSIINNGSVSSVPVTGPTGYGTVDALSFSGLNYLTTSYYSANLYNQDFTIEGWFNLPSTIAASTNAILFAHRATLAPIGVVVFVVTGTDDLAFGVADGTNWLVLQNATNVNFTADWQHVALTREVNTYRLFKDGVEIASGTSSTAVGVTGNFTLMAATSAGLNPVPGDVFDFRVTEGVARYTADFTPPTASFPTNAPIVGRRGVGTEATLRTRGYLGAAPGGGMLTLYDRYVDTLP